MIFLGGMKMAQTDKQSEPKPVANFALGLRLLQFPNGKTAINLETLNNGVPIEMIIMQLRAFLRRMEKDYFNNIDKSTTKFSKKD